MSANLETLEMESLGEFEDEWEGEGEDEAFLGGLLRGVGSMLGIGGGGDGEQEDEVAHEWEDESAHELFQEAGHEMEDEAFLGGLLGSVGSALGLGESEWEDEATHEWELAPEHEQEQFIGRAFRGIRRFVKKNAGLLKQVARIAAPMVATAVGGPLGGMLARTAVSQLREHEYEVAGEFEHEHEHEHEQEQEAIHEALAAMTEHEAMAEHMAAVAAGSHSEAEAEAMTGAAVISALSAADLRALRQVRASLVRGAAVLTRLLRSRRATRPLVRTVPTIMRRTARVLNRQAAAGRPITRRTAARVMARQTRQVLGSPRVCSAVLVRNVRANRAVARTPQRSTRPSARIVRG